MAKKRSKAKPTTKETFRVEVKVILDVAVDKSLMPTEEWRSVFYQLFTLEDVAKHVAYAYVRGADQLSRLDGYADREDSMVEINEVDTEVDTY